MPTKQVTANTSGAILWREHAHKKGVLTGLKVHNPTANDEKITLYDCFVAVSSVSVSGGGAGAAQAPEYLGVSGAASGLRRLETIVPAGEFLSLSEEDFKECEFYGRAEVVADTTSSDCIIIAQYKLR